jgi:hypothetical protein
MDYNTTQELDRVRNQLSASGSPQDILGSRTLKWLIGRGIRKSALERGDKVADFSLPDTHGNSVMLSSLLEQGPAVISFYRGGWCPFCTIELR